MFYVYVLRCKDGSLYTGYTNDVKKRLESHQKGTASKYTRSRRPVKIAASWKYKTKSEAIRAEAAFKKLSRSEKLSHIKTSLF